MSAEPSDTLRMRMAKYTKNARADASPGPLDRPHLVKDWRRWGRAPLQVLVCVLGFCPEGGPRTGRVQYQRIAPSKYLLITSDPKR